MTDKLYYKNSYIREFDAKVISCQPFKSKYSVVLDKTAFFPEGGGQASDTGYIGNSEVSHVCLSDGVIIHTVSEPLNIGEIIPCSIDWSVRFRRMQNHSGEHILSGLAHSTFGCENVGFHLSDNEMTIDFNLELTYDQLAGIELAANKAIYENIPIRTEFPSAEELSGIDYRSKLELTEDVRLVFIEGYDICACCAPHVRQTGEIGIIKITSIMRHRKGTRITAICGIDAYMDYAKKHSINAEISALLSAKSAETLPAVKHTLADIKLLKIEIYNLKQELVNAYLQNTSENNFGNICLFNSFPDIESMRMLVNRLIERDVNICAVFSGDDSSGYKYIMASKKINMVMYSKEFNSALNGRGGGKPCMVQGNVNASAFEIKSFFQK